MNLTLFREYLDARGVSLSAIARVLGISRQAIAMKMSGKTKFRADELETIANYLRMSDEEIIRIFYAQKLTNRLT